MLLHEYLHYLLKEIPPDRKELDCEAPSIAAPRIAALGLRALDQHRAATFEEPIVDLILAKDVLARKLDLHSFDLSYASFRFQQGLAILEGIDEQTQFLLGHLEECGNKTLRDEIRRTREEFSKIGRDLVSTQEKLRRLERRAEGSRSSL